MFQFFKEIYFTAFIIFFRAGSADWTPTINASKGVAAVALIESAFLIGIASWIDIYFRIKSLFDNSKLTAILAFLILCAVNHFLLVVRGHGIKYEREFSHVTKNRKIFLVVSCVILMLASVVFFVISANAHRHFIKAGLQ